MTKLARYMLIACGLGGLSACSVATDLINQGRTYGAAMAAELAMAECAAPIAIRKANAEAVAAYLAEQGSPAKFTLDCDGDGQPDF